MKTNKEFVKEITKLSLPLGLQMMVSNIVSLIDNIMIGSLGEAAMSAVAICVAYQWLAVSLVYSVSAGALIIGSQYYGTGDTNRIKKLMSFSIFVSLIYTAFNFILSTFFPSKIISTYTNIESVIPLGAEYLSILKYSFLFYAVSETIIIILLSVKSVKVGLRISLVSCLTNLTLDFLLINGNLGFPALGIKGAAIGTTASRFVEMALAVYYLLHKEEVLDFKLKDFKITFDSNLMKQLFKVTLPLFIIDLLENFLSSAQTMITGRISENYLSANSIVHNSWELPAVFCRGAASAAAVIMGNSLGKKDFVEAKKDSKRIIYTGLVLGLACSISVQIILNITLPFYDNISKDTEHLARLMSYACSFNVIFISLDKIINNGIINAGGKTKKVLYADLISNWFVAIPLGYLGAFVFKFHPAIIYLFLRIGYLIKTIFGLINVKKETYLHSLT